MIRKVLLNLALTLSMIQAGQPLYAAGPCTHCDHCECPSCDCADGNHCDHC